MAVNVGDLSVINTTPPFSQPHSADRPVGRIQARRRVPTLDLNGDEAVTVENNAQNDAQNDVLAPYLQPAVRGIDSESPPDSFASSDTETIAAVDETRNETDRNANATERELRRLGPHNNPGNRESTSSVIRGRLRSNTYTVGRTSSSSSLNEQTDQ